jgi:5-methylcytosine-specific restriction endonuclease McrA
MPSWVVFRIGGIMSVLKEPCLVLNRNWEAIDTYTVQKALTHVFAGARCMITEDVQFERVDEETRLTEPVAFNAYDLLEFSQWIELPVNEDAPEGTILRTGHLSIRVPEIIVLNSSSQAKRRRLSCTKRNLARRDNHICQYCGKKVAGENETTDHIIPQSKNGPHGWMNCVLACKGCNGRKRDRPLHETGMTLIERDEMKEMYPNDPSTWCLPYEPNWSPIFRVPYSRRKACWQRFVN